jgi:hypothetical protein
MDMPADNNPAMFVQCLLIQDEIILDIGIGSLAFRTVLTVKVVVALHGLNDHNYLHAANCFYSSNL